MKHKSGWFVQLVLGSLLLYVSADPEPNPEPGKTREPKMFLVSSTTYTTTISTSTVCYKAGTLVSTCGKRKKRAMISNSVLDDDGYELDMEPSRTSRDFQFDTDEALINTYEKQGKRTPRVQVYWMTTTSTTTSTSYTVTSTMATVTCTPNGWSYSTCSG